ncbi:type II secretion system F family protein [Polycladidibacter hongkongensis]|uniref:type II secretion system F family protein n=1 Tax=Polycladidibacter hongkongensis TaxID=1647556 RepID=UPI00082A5752|nr:type II secretion system F family protein [Pseudovibrio hongkongensis]
MEFSRETLLMVLVGFCVAGVIYALLIPLLSSGARKSQRMKLAVKREEHAEEITQRASQNTRKKNIQDQLRNMEEKQKQKNNKPSFADWIAQAGLTWSRQYFLFVSIGLSVVGFAVGMVLGAGLWLSIGLAFVGFLGMPRWVVGYLRKKRFNKFLEEFPGAVEIIVRGVKSGLPLNDCISIIVREANEPVKTEFRKIIETQQMGVSLSEAIQSLPKRVPLAEANFFAIVISIQSESGGSLSEALGNLSKVLRDRKAMKGKVQAVSQEAKSSAAIIGSLPILVATAVYFLSPDYIMLLFTETTGNIILGICAFWMSLGILIMRSMINFEI